jgi:hypothetical protein
MDATRRRTLHVVIVLLVLNLVVSLGIYLDVPPVQFVPVAVVAALAAVFVVPVKVFAGKVGE